ncbi:MAG: flagellar export chaperone FlgN [Pseudomonadales bacterium]|nr:flagellar export chaperone FlgN [Pseudomonadales bacterium]
MSDTALIRDILTLGNELKVTLEEEFIALSEKNLDHLETVQLRKVELLQSIQTQWPTPAASDDPGAEAIQDTADPLWDEARTLINECKEAHIRNDLLLKRQLEVVRTVLSSLTQRSEDNHSALYDKMGRMKRKR